MLEITLYIYIYIDNYRENSIYMSFLIFEFYIFESSNFNGVLI